jgi:hypothetical protein
MLFNALFFIFVIWRNAVMDTGGLAAGEGKAVFRGMDGKEGVFRLLGSSEYLNSRPKSDNEIV